MTSILLSRCEERDLGGRTAGSGTPLSLNRVERHQCSGAQEWGPRCLLGLSDAGGPAGPTLSPIRQTTDDVTQCDTGPRVHTHVHSKQVVLLQTWRHKWDTP